MRPDGREQVDCELRQRVAERGQVGAATIADLSGDEFRDAGNEDPRRDPVQGRELWVLGSRPGGECGEHLLEPRELASPLFERTRPGSRQLDQVGPGDGRSIVPPDEIPRHAVLERDFPARAGLKGEQLAQQLIGELIAEGEEAVELVGEERVEAVTGHTRGRYDVRHSGVGIADLAHALEHRPQQALPLRREHLVRRKLVPPPRQRIPAPGAIVEDAAHGGQLRNNEGGGERGLAGDMSDPVLQMPERVLVNFFYAHPVGHAVEALHYCLGHHAADPEREIAVALNAATAVELAGFCPFVSGTYAVDHPLLEPCPDSAQRQAIIPRKWDWVLDDFRRHQDIQLALFPGLRDYYRASDDCLTTTRGRSVVGATAPGFVPHQQLRFALPETARVAAAQRLAPHAAAPRIALMPAGSSDAALYPSVESWVRILDALADAFGDVQIALIGKRRRDAQTVTSIAGDDLATLLAHPTRPLDCFDLGLAEQLAVVEACGLFLAPHTGFGLAALAVGTPWLALSGGRWFEYFFNRVPFRSIIPDTDRYPCFTQFDAAEIVDDGDGARTPSMSRDRIRDDLERIVAAADELLGGSLEYDTALGEYFRDLIAAHRGDTSQIWSVDGVHLAYV